MSSTVLQRIEGELERIGLLLQHDAELPSVTALAAGEPIRGSWWADPRCHELYDLMQELEHRGPVLTAKVVNGKVTYVHRRLWPALLVVVQNPAPERLGALSAVAHRLHRHVGEHGTARADELRRSGFAQTAELTKVIRQLELALLVHTDEVHTETGAHAKVLQTWERWATQHGLTAGASTAAAARQVLESAVEMLCARGSRRPKLPW